MVATCARPRCWSEGPVADAAAWPPFISLRPKVRRPPEFSGFRTRDGRGGLSTEVQKMSRKKERRRTDVDARIATAAAAQETLFLPFARGRVHPQRQGGSALEFGVKASIVTTNGRAPGGQFRAARSRTVWQSL